MEEHDNAMSALDMDVVAGLRELGGDDDPGLFDELVGLFIEESDSQLRKLQAAVSELAYADVEVIAHTLKSSSANLGAFGMSELCMQLEESGRDQEAARVGSLCARLDDVYTEVRRGLEGLRRR